MWKSMILQVECIVCNKTLEHINHNPVDASRKMGKIAQRRSRTPNWSADEKKYLLELIKGRRSVITKNANGPTHYEEKDVAWNEILHELAKRFGSKFNGSSIKKVKTQWQNMKRIAREEITLNGPELEKYSSQSLEVCNILNLVKDGVLRTGVENANFNETVVNNDNNIEVKTERIEEDTNPPQCSSKNFINTDEQQDEIRIDLCQPNNLIQFECSSSASEMNSELLDSEPQENDKFIHLKSVSVNTEANTESMYMDDTTFNHSVSLHRNYQDFLRYTATERNLKVEALKEERQVMRAMRETAELNKIIAEQRLKHVLWVKKQDMAMYSGEPGSGAGKGGGGGGSIREAGGSFGKMEAAREDQYFYNKQKEQIENMKKHLDKEISFHQEQIKLHEDAIRRHKNQMTEMEKK